MMEQKGTQTGILVAGHRGNPAHFPENTMASFRDTMEAGIDMIELDVQMSQDGELVIMHDLTVDRTTDGSGAIREMTLSQIRSLDAGCRRGEEFCGERVPLLEEFLELGKGYPGMLYDFELKEYPVPENESRAYETADRTISLIERYGLADRCVLNAFSARLLWYIHDKYEGRYSLHGYYPKSLLGETGGRDPYDILYCACVCEDFTPENFRQLKERGIETWVGARFDNRQMLELARECGASLVTCNNPREVTAILQEMGLHA